jgi:hypothetical protein
MCTWKIKGQLDATDWILLQNLIVRSTCFGHHYAHHQELKNYTDGCCLWILLDTATRTHKTYSSTTDQRPENQRAMYAVLATSFDLDTTSTQYATAPINDLTLKSSKRMFAHVD